MRIVLDTNVLIAALISRGLCHELFEHCSLNHHLVTSEFILSETAEKLAGKFGYSAELVVAAVQLLSQLEIVAPAALDWPVCRDPDDDNIIATALSGKCDRIISGDKDLLAIGEHAGFRIVSPRQFLDSEVGSG